MKCSDCGKTFNEFDSKIIMKESKDMGVYYEGPPICSKCGDKRYEQARSEYEFQKDTQ